MFYYLNYILIGKLKIWGMKGTLCMLLVLSATKMASKLPMIFHMTPQMETW